MNSELLSLINNNLSNICKVFPKKDIEKLSGRILVNIEPESHKESDFSQYSCLYYEEQLSTVKFLKLIFLKELVSLS